MKSKFTLAFLAISIAAGLCALYVRRSIVPASPQEQTFELATPMPAKPAFRITEESRAKDLAAELLRTSSETANPILGPKPKELSQRSRQRARDGTQILRRKPEPQAPEARFALTWVGADDLAEEIWAEAINDPTLPPDERQDLIEDLNEEGFLDPQHVTFDDLPLILSRLALIERVSPDAIDEVNAEAFAEAYRDLVNMVGSLAQE